MNNLGSPLAAEHTEYFRNQQEFVPILVHAIDPEIRWAARDVAGTQRTLLSNLRIALIAPLARIRMIFFAVPFVAVGALIHGQALLTIPSADEPARHGLWDRTWLQDMLLAVRRLADGTPFDGIAGFCYETIWVQDMLIVLLLALMIYSLTDVYTNFFWQSLGRAPQSWAPDESQARGRRLPYAAIALVWLPSLLAPATILLFVTDFSPHALGRSWLWIAFWVVLAFNTLACLVEIAFAEWCIAAFEAKDPSVFMQPMRESLHERYEAFLRTS